MKPSLSSQDRFWAQVRKTDACWLWAGTRFKDGYGRFYSDRRTRPAHIFAWSFANGPVPQGMFVCHTCDNKPCVRPSHLFLGTPRDNVVDMVTKGRQAIGVRNGAARLTPDIVAEMRRRYDAGTSIRAIARSFPISRTQARNIVLGLYWKQVPA